MGRNDYAFRPSGAAAPEELVSGPCRDGLEMRWETGNVDKCIGENADLQAGKAGAPEFGTPETARPATAKPDPKAVVLTGDRPTGRLHIGHYVGSIQKRLELQDYFESNYVMIADMQALTDNAHEPAKVRENVLEVCYDYLACGIDPRKSCIFIQSLVPELTELTVLYLNFVTLARLKRNPTVKSEMAQKGFGDTVPVGFLTYPVSQAADITGFNTSYVPVGEDQLPMLEQTNEIVRHINRFFNARILKECKPLLSRVGRLPGTDGAAKMGKSLGNCIYLSDDAKTIHDKVMGMFTDPNHLRVDDPGNVEINPVFTYLDAFDPNPDELAAWKEHYRRGGLGDMKVKRRLDAILQEKLGAIRERRVQFEQDPRSCMDMLKANSVRAREVCISVLKRLKQAMQLDY